MLEDWSETEGVLKKTFIFTNYYETIAFVNAVAWIAHKEDHHPDIEISYKTCILTYVTHSEGILTDKDYHSAAQIEALFTKD
jgi:4a-hydroxytetrahydrobiopterin dehydratase